MTLYVGSTVLNVADLHRATAFWTAALGYVVRDAPPTFVVLTDPRRRWSNVSLQRSDAPKGGRNRLHLDLYTKTSGRKSPGWSPSGPPACRGRTLPTPIT